MAVAIRVLQRDGTITRAAVVDVDVHQGNGTAFIFDGDPAVFTFSIHQEHNYPHVKPRGSLDVGLPDGTGDHEYLHALERALPGRAWPAGPTSSSTWPGRTRSSRTSWAGCASRTKGCGAATPSSLSSARDAGIPVVIVFAGGYARRVEDTAAIHVATIEEASGSSA